jgi:hypothetical protein
MLKADHRLDAVGQQFIEQLVVVRRIVFIDRDVFIIGEKARPVNRRAVVGQPRQLHQLHVFAKAVDKIGRHRRAVAVMPDVAVVFVPEIRPGVLALFLPLQPSVCHAEAAAPRIKSWGSPSLLSSLCPHICWLAWSFSAWRWAFSARREAILTNGR